MHGGAKRQKERNGSWSCPPLTKQPVVPISCLGCLSSPDPDPDFLFLKSPQTHLVFGGAIVGKKRRKVKDQSEGSREIYNELNKSQKKEERTERKRERGHKKICCCGQDRRGKLGYIGNLKAGWALKTAFPSLTMTRGPHPCHPSFPTNGFPITSPPHLPLLFLSNHSSNWTVPFPYTYTDVNSSHCPAHGRQISFCLPPSISSEDKDEKNGGDTRFPGHGNQRPNLLIWSKAEKVEERLAKP